MCKRGDIYYVDFGEKSGSKQGGIRPALVVSNNKANKHSPVVTVVPLSARVWKKKYLPTHVQIPKGSGLSRPSDGTLRNRWKRLIRQDLVTESGKCWMTWSWNRSPWHFRYR